MAGTGWQSVWGDPHEVPDAVRAAIASHHGRRITDGWSAASTWRLERVGAAPLFLKRDSDRFPDELAHERAVMDWLAGRLSAPRVVAEGAASGARWLVTTAVPGEMAYEVGIDRRQVVSLVARKLRDVHAIDPDTCPFDRTLPTMLGLARYAIDHGNVDPSDFDGERRGRPVEALWRELNDSKPDDEDPVFCHGDFCLPNVLVSGNSVTGVVDWGRAGVSDRYRDLAIASRSVGDNFGKEYEPLFFEAYGVAEVDQDKVRFYRLLDEFF